MAEKIRIAIIGCGGISRGHVERLLSIPEVEIAALVEPAPANIERLRTSHPAVKDTPSFTDYKDIFEEVELDAVQINSPHNVHYEQIMASLDHGLHVLTEKPMVCTTEHAVDVMRRQKKTGLVVSISYQRHSQGVFQCVKRAIEEGDIGEVQFVTSFQGQNWLRATKGTWRQELAVSCGGQLNDSGSHLIDIILYATGLKAAEVFGYTENFDAEVDINSAVSIRFRNGALGTINIVGDYPSRFHEETTIVGEEGVIMLKGIGGQEVILHKRGETHRISDFHYGSKSADHNFIAAIQGKEEVLAPPECGLRTIELTEAIWKAAESGKPVVVKEQDM